MIDNKDLELKLKICINFLFKEIISLDPVIRKQWIYTYKGIIKYVESHKSELSHEQIIGASIYVDLIKRVEEFIEEEDFEGQNFNRFNSRDSSDTKYEDIYKKRLEQMKKDFPLPENLKNNKI